MQWHVTIARAGQSKNLVDSLASLDCITEVCAPRRVEYEMHRGAKIERSRSWLGPLVLARWVTDDPFAWHDVYSLSDVSGILGGWQPAVVSDEAVQVLLDTIQVIETKGQVILTPPCQPGSIVRFTHLAFYRLVARCVWVSDVQIGLRLSLLGHDTVIPVPWSAVEQRDVSHRKGR
jgi:hypothetical protein